MLAAARQLMAETGGIDFTLTDVSKAGKVSIGSIYCRFDSKDALLHAVQVRVLEEVDAEQFALIDQADAKARGLGDLVYQLVEGMAENFRANAPLMRPLMLMASHDETVAATGKRSYAKVADRVREVLLKYDAEILQDDPRRAVDSAYRVLYASIARYLGFGSSVGAAWEGDWKVLKEDLAAMIAAFLTTPTPTRKR